MICPVTSTKTIPCIVFSIQMETILNCRDKTFLICLSESQINRIDKTEPWFCWRFLQCKGKQKRSSRSEKCEETAAFTSLECGVEAAGCVQPRQEVIDSSGAVASNHTVTIQTEYWSRRRRAHWGGTRQLVGTHFDVRRLQVSCSAISAWQKNTTLTE